MSMSEYLRLIALGDTPTLRAKMGIPKTQADAGIAAGQTGAQAAGSDYDALVTHRQNAANHAFDMTRGGTNTPGVPAGGAGRGRVFTKNILSPTIQLGGTAVALLRNVMKNEEEAAVAADPDMSSFRPEDREFFRTKVEPIRQKLMQPKKDAAKTKADTSKKKLDASLLPVVGAGSDAYPNLSEKYLKDKWHQRFTMPGEMSANVKGVSGDDAIQALALEATTAFRAGDEAGYKKAGEITADINSRLLTMGLKPKNPILIGGINQSGPLGNIGITALVPKEDGSGFRIVVTPRSGQGYGAPVDISSTPEPALPDLASLGDDFTEESYLNAFKDEGQQALAKAIEERDSALTPTPQGRRYRPRAR